MRTCLSGDTLQRIRLAPRFGRSAAPISGQFERRNTATTDEPCSLAGILTPSPPPGYRRTQRIASSLYPALGFESLRRSKKITLKGAIILDPAVGERRLIFAEISRHFTGVALELTPNAEFKSQASAPRVSFRTLTGKVLGLKRSLFQIFAVAVVLELFAIVAPLFNQMVVDDVLSSGDRDLLAVLVLGFGLLLLVQTTVGLARSWMVMVLGQTLSLQWTSNVFSHLVRLPVAYFKKRHLGDITSRFGAVGAIQRTLTRAAIEAVLDG